MSEKVERTHPLCEDHVRWLEEVVSSYDLPDAGKALRIVLDYCIQEGDRDAIFGEVRCRHC